MHAASFFTRSGSALTVSVCLTICAGCQTPERQARRDDNILRLVESYRMGERVRPANLGKDWQLIDAQRLQHVQKLDATKLLIKETHLKDQRRWIESAPKRQDAFHTIFSGRPQKIEETWRRMGP